MIIIYLNLQLFESTIHTNKKDKTLYIKIKDYNDVNNSLCGTLNEIEDQFFDFAEYNININSNDKYKNIIYQNKAISIKDYNTNLLHLAYYKNKK